MLNLNYFTLRRTHKCRCVVAIAELSTLLTRAVLNKFLTHEALSVHSHQRSEAVAAMYVHALRNGAETMCRVEVATVLHVVLQAPVKLRSVVIVWVVPICVPVDVERVNVSALRAYDLAKETLLRHVERRKFVVVVAAILEDEAVETLTLRQVDKTPALLEVHCRGHLDSDMLAVLHSVLRHGVVVIPVGCDVYEVYIVALAQRLVAMLAIVYICGHHARLVEETLTRISTLTLIVAQCNYLNTRNMHKAHHSPWTAHTETHKAHTQRLDGLYGETHDMLLTLGSLGAIHHDSATIPMPCCRL